MKITFNINEDDSFKKEIKQLVRGELKNLVREEITETIKEEIKKKVENIKITQPDFINAMIKAIKEILYKEYKVTDWGTQYIDKIIIDTIEKQADFVFNQLQYQEKIDREIDKRVKLKIDKMLEGIRD